MTCLPCRLLLTRPIAVQRSLYSGANLLLVKASQSFPSLELWALGISGPWVMVSLPLPELPFPSWGWFSTVAELALLIFSLSCQFCQISWWPTDSAFFVPSISGILLFPRFSNLPLDLRSLKLVKPETLTMQSYWQLICPSNNQISLRAC